MSAVLSIPNQSDEIISYNPATGVEIGHVPLMTERQVRESVERSRTAFEIWRMTTFAERSRLVMRAREVVLAGMEEIAHLISAESGKPFGEAIAMELAPGGLNQVSMMKPSSGGAL